MNYLKYIIVIALYTIILGYLAVGEKFPYGEYFTKASSEIRLLNKTCKGLWEPTNLYGSIKKCQMLYKKDESYIKGVHHILKKDIYDLAKMLSIESYGVQSFKSYISNYDEANFLLVTDYGGIFLVDENSLSSQEIPSNLSRMVNKYGVRSLFFDKGNKYLYVSYLKEFEPGRCNSLAVAKGAVNVNDFRSIEFKPYFQSDSCIKGETVTGGRISKNGDKLFLTIGGDPSPEIISTDYIQGTQVGSVLELDEKGGVTVFAKGTRNSLGMAIANGRIIISDNGPMGADLLTSVRRGDNFGWPKYSYGFEYSGKDIYLKPSGIISVPDHYFTPSVGASQLIQYKSNLLSRFTNKILFASLKAQSLFLIDYDFSSGKVRSIEPYRLGYRIRDLMEDDRGKIWLTTDDGKLISLTRGDGDIPDKN